MRVSNTGSVFVDLNLGNAADEFGPIGTGTRIAPGQYGRVDVAGWVYDASTGNAVPLSQSVSAYFYTDDQVVPPA